MATATDFLMDISDNISGKQKMVKRLFSDEIVPSLNFSEPIGLRTFLSVVGHTEPCVRKGRPFRNNTPASQYSFYRAN